MACRLLSGKLKVVKANGLTQRHVGTVLPGEFVGEIGLFENKPRSATVKALVRSELEVLDQAGLQALLRRETATTAQLIETLSQRVIGLSQHSQKLAKAHAAQLDTPTLARLQQLANSVSETYEITGERFERDFSSLQRGMSLEAQALKGMLQTYHRYLKREASAEQMEQANAEFRNFIKTLGIGTLFLLPGSPITIPAAIKAAQSLGIDILPKNRLTEDQD